MRKLTGYIGALIIVFALMGSILAGYALNVNGSSSVINEYERVTDVSGLYTHSQEPSYIEYNPASNYIGYSTTITNTNDSNLGYQKLTGNATISKTNMKITINGNTRDIGNAHYLFIVDNVCWAARYGSDINVFMYYGGGTMVIGTSTDIILNVSGTTTTITFNGTTHTFTNIGLTLINCDPNLANYGMMDEQSGITKDVYVNDINEIVGTITRTWYGGFVGNTVRGYDSNNVVSASICTNIIDMGDGVKKTTIGAGWSIGGGAFFYPLNVYSGIGINYTESNRVNNYLVNTDPGSTVTRTDTIDLMGISAGDLYPAQEVRFRSAMLLDDYNMDYNGYRLWARWMGPYYSPNYPVYDEHNDAIHRYSLYDIINTYTIPAGADYLTITGNSSDIRNYSYLNNTFSFDMNMVAFYINDGNAPGIIYDVAEKKDYIVYDVTNYICKLYSYDGVLKGTGTPDQIGVIFLDNTYSWARVQLRWVEGDYNVQSLSDVVEMANRARPFITIQSTTVNPANNHYMDITKGISIKSDNPLNVIWDNQYSNGNIQLLFRAESTNLSYHNGIIVGDNTISIDYNDNGFSVTLNGGDPVAVGKWRNIVLNMDLRTGELSAIPVRTFNSYTNVVLDTASIVIGNLINPTPTNTIEWTPTSNSFMFNVYSTAVFMNTYGVVMVNPQLNITDYFTDLNGFYRMRLYNFTILGSSITVNGVTANVSNNSITINDQTVQIKDMAITYADGHAYISDSNVNIDLGEIVNYNISMDGAWYFETELLKGFTSQKLVYNWDWGDFILNNTQFCIMYIGIALVALMIARHYCTLSITDYIVLIVSFAIALTVQVVA